MSQTMTDRPTTVAALLAERLKITEEEVNEDLAINGVWQWDSLAHLELMMYLEEEFAVTIDEDSILACSSARGLSEFLGLDLT